MKTTLCMLHPAFISASMKHEQIWRISILVPLACPYGQSVALVLIQQALDAAILSTISHSFQIAANAAPSEQFSSTCVKSLLVLGRQLSKCPCSILRSVQTS